MRQETSPGGGEKLLQGSGNGHAGVEPVSMAVTCAEAVDVDWTKTFDYQTLIEEELDEYSNIVVTQDLREGGIHAQKAWGHWFKFLSDDIWKTSLQNEIVSFCNSINNPRILSLGCGYGGVELTVARSLKKPFSMLALDINDGIFTKGREEAKTNGYDITFQALDLNFVNIQANSFDLIFAHASLHHLLNLEHVFRQVYNALRPDGRLIVQDIIGKTQVLFWKENVDFARSLVRHMPEKYVGGLRDRENIIPAFVEPAIQKGMEGIRQEEIEAQINKYFDPVRMFRFGSFMRMICTHPVLGLRLDPDVPSDRGYLESLCREDIRLIQDGRLRPTEMLAVYRKKGRVDCQAIDTEARARLTAELANNHDCSNQGPLVSIIIPVERFTNALQRCLTSILEKTQHRSLEIIVVGDECASEEVEVVKALKERKVSLIVVPAGTGVAEACNAAMHHSRGEFVVFLDPNISVKRGWLEHLVKSATSTPRPAGVTSKVLNVDGAIVEAGCSAIEGSNTKCEGTETASNAPDRNFVRSVDSGSMYCMLVEKRALRAAGGLDKRVSTLGLALLDVGIALRAGGGTVLYQPMSCAQLYREKADDLISLSPTGERLKALRPRVTQLLHNNGAASGSETMSVLILGIYLADRLNNVEDIVANLSKSLSCNVVQRWMALGGNPPSNNVANVTSDILHIRKPKYEILNDMMAEENFDDYDYVITMDDDIVLPDNFIDEFISRQASFGYAIAQPARTRNSYIDHPIVCQQDGVLARRTRFVEIGPVTSFHHSIFDLVFPFDLTSSMGWGYENVWSLQLMQRNQTMGIIDCTPVDHSLRKPVENYTWKDADKERIAFLGKHEHLALEECFSVVDVVSDEGVTS